MEFSIFLLYALFLWVLAIVLIVGDVNLFKKNMNFKKEHDLSKYSIFDYKGKSLILYVVLMFFSILSFVLNDSFDMKVINSAIFAMSLCESVTILFNSKLFYNEKEIIYEGDIYRIKSLKPAVKVKRFGRSYEINTFDGKVITVNEKTASLINTLIEEKKEEKQARKRK